jgi:hypothetical protein
MPKRYARELRQAARVYRVSAVPLSGIPGRLSIQRSRNRRLSASALLPPTKASASGSRSADHRTIEGRVAEREQPAVGGHFPVTAPVGGGGHAHDGLVQRLAAHRAVESGVPEGEDAAVGRRRPVAVAARTRCHCLPNRCRLRLEGPRAAVPADGVGGPSKGPAAAYAQDVGGNLADRRRWTRDPIGIIGEDRLGIRPHRWGRRQDGQRPRRAVPGPDRCRLTCIGGLGGQERGPAQGR